MLFHTSVFGAPAVAPSHDVVEWSSERKRLREADVVVVHVPSWRMGRRIQRYPGQVWVAWSQESRVHYPALGDPTFMRHFDLRMTYETEADVWVPYLPGLAEWRRIAEAPVAVQRETAPVAAFVSGAADGSGRTDFLREMARYVPIDFYGRLFNNRQLAEDRGLESKLAAVARYPFCIAFENSISADYVTEKVFDALRAGSVPVYLGAPNVKAFVPEGSIIDAADFGGAREVGAYLRYLAAHPAEVARYHAWRERPLPQGLMVRAASVEREAFVRLADLCAERRGRAPTRRELGVVRRVADEIAAAVRGWGRRAPGP